MDYAGQLEALGFDLAADAQVRAARPADSAARATRLGDRFELRGSKAVDSRLVPMDASSDRDEMLARYPNGRTHVVAAGSSGSDPCRRQSNLPRWGYLVSIDPA